MIMCSLRSAPVKFPQGLTYLADRLTTKNKRFVKKSTDFLIFDKSMSGKGGSF